MPPAAVASRSASAIASRSLSCVPRSSSIAARMSRTGSCDVLGAESSARTARPGSTCSIATSCASSDWISTFSSDAWRSISREALASSCARAPARPRRSVGSSGQLRSSPSRSIARSDRAARVSSGLSSGRGSCGCVRRTSAACRPPGSSSRPTSSRARREIGEDADLARALHRVLDAIDQLLAVGESRWMSPMSVASAIMRATSGSALTHLTAPSAGRTRAMSNLSRLLPIRLSK